MCKSYKLDMSTVTKKKKKQTKESQDLMFIDAEDELFYEVSQALTLFIEYTEPRGWM